jgi:hypothetical protein
VAIKSKRSLLNTQVENRSLVSKKKAEPLTAHTRKAKLFRQSKTFVSFGIFVSTKAFRSSFLALQVFAKRYWQYELNTQNELVVPII